MTRYSETKLPSPTVETAHDATANLSTTEEAADVTDEQGRNPGEPGFGDGDDGHLHSDESDAAPNTGQPTHNRPTELTPGDLK